MASPLAGDDSGLPEGPVSESVKKRHMVEDPSVEGQPSKRPREAISAGDGPDLDETLPRLPAVSLDLKPLDRSMDSSPEFSMPLAEVPALESEKTQLTILDRIDMTQTCLTEEQVGIRKYINPSLPTFSAILKHRFTDFLVYEVDDQGQVVHLKDITDPRQQSTVAKPQSESACPRSPPNEWPSDADEKLSSILASDELSSLKSFISQGPVFKKKVRKSQAKKFERKTSVGSTTLDAEPKEMVEQPENKSDNDQNGNRSLPTSIVSNPIESKERRKQLHQAIREVFHGRLVTEHKEVPGSGAAVEISWSRPGENTQRKPKAINAEPPFIHFTLQKTNRETQDALSILSRLLHCHVSKDLQICGTKDKRAVSCQRVSLRRNKRTIEDVWSAVHHIKKGQKLQGSNFLKERGEKGIRVGDFTYADKSLKLGQLKGNRFVIVLRDVIPAQPHILKEAVDTLATRGFLNYFGMQRFGTTAVGTHLVGLSLLRGEWDLAIDLIMRRKSGEAQDIEFARNIWLDAKDARAAFNKMPRRCIAERSILQFFSNRTTQTDKQGALANIPKNLRMMYIHAYQSYLWNTILSERVDLYGCDKPVVGDLVKLKDSDTQDHTADGAEPEAEAVEDPELRVSQSKRSHSVKILETAQDCEAYTIFDVVHPLIGYNVKYPGNQLGDRYKKLMEQDGLDPDKLYRSQAEYSMAGTYRKIVHLPEDVRCHLYEYTDPDQPLSQSDEDVLLGMEFPTPKEWTADSAEERGLAAKVEFTLTSSAYATMSLREILKSDTGKKAQSEMTQRMRERVTVSDKTAEEKEVSENGEG